MTTVKCDTFEWPFVMGSWWTALFTTHLQTDKYTGTKYNRRPGLLTMATISITNTKQERQQRKHLKKWDWFKFEDSLGWRMFRLDCGNDT
jgi:polyisoprenoid-binding protein YceI